LSSAKDWHDGGIDLASLPSEIAVDGERLPRSPTDGYGTFEPGVPWWSMSFAVPMRRLMTENWLRPIARTGRHADEEQPLGARSTRLKPQTTGELFLYVNDAVLGFPGTWSHFYTNNRGTVEVEIRMISEPASY